MFLYLISASNDILSFFFFCIVYCEPQTKRFYLGQVDSMQGLVCAGGLNTDLILAIHSHYSLLSFISTLNTTLARCLVTYGQGAHKAASGVSCCGTQTCCPWSCTARPCSPGTGPHNHECYTL